MLTIEPLTNTIGESLGIPSLSNGSILVLCSKLYLPVLSSLAQVSKEYYKITGCAPLWQRLCSEAKILTTDLNPRFSFFQAVNNLNEYALFACAQLYLNGTEIAPQNDRAHLYLDKILSKENLEKKFKAHVQLEKARLHVNSGSENLTDEACAELLGEIIQNEQVLVEDTTEAQFLIASMGFLKRHPTLSDGEVDQIFLSISQNEQASATLRVRAEFMRASLCFYDRSHSMNKGQADSLLATISQNAHVSDLHAYANLKRAVMRCLDQTGDNCLSDPDTDLLLKSLRADESAPISVHLEADFYRAKLKCEKRTDSMKDEDADDLLLSVINNKDSPLNLKTEAKLLRAELRLLLRTCSMTDEETDEVLLDISQNPEMPQVFCARADFMRASLRCQLRTHSIKDVEVYGMLTRISLSDRIFHLNLPASLLAKAALLRADLHLQNRSNKFSTQVHISELSSLVSKPLPKDIICQSSLMLGKLQLHLSNDPQSCSRSSNTTVMNHSFTHSPVINRNTKTIEQLLVKMSAQPSLPLNMRLEADLLRVRFGLEGLSTSLSKEDQGQILLHISQNPEASSELRNEADQLIVEIEQSKAPTKDGEGDLPQ